MKAAVLHEFGGKLAIGDWPVKPKTPLIPGHEAIGYVAALDDRLTGQPS
jgi:D-arabinose 1-dehydrogenase-like Zn-dependent alcohol dehydrogenase